MGWGSKSELIANNAAQTKEIELLREQLHEKNEELSELRKQLRYTQDALIAKESPEAYHDRKMSEELAKREELTPEEREKQEKQMAEAKIARQYINELENPLFLDRDDMIQRLIVPSGIPGSEQKSLHGNDES